MADAEKIGHDDHSLSRVPASERYSWFTVAVQRFGQLSALSQFLLGATLGYGMSFWSAFWALTLGAIILEIVAIFTGIAGQREGLSTSVLARWAGFGRYGSSLIGLVFAVSLIGWFGVQNAVFAEGLHSLVGGLPIWVWSIVTGLAVTLVVVYGFLSMAWVAYITVPAFLLLAGYSIFSALQKYPLGELVTSPAPGKELSLAAATTIVAGGFIVGAVITPDMTRFNRSAADVIKQTVLGITLGEYTIGLIGVLLAHAVKSENVITIVTSTSGVIGTLVLIAGTLKINDWNLYSSSLGLANFIDSVFAKRFNRAAITIAVGLFGTVLSAAGILEHFQGFLTLLGLAVPPIAGIMVVDYFVLQRHRNRLAESGRAGSLPARQEKLNPITIVAWFAASAVGYFSEERFGIPALNSLLCAALSYYVLMRVIAALQNRPYVEFSETSTIR
ncbi:purine-cytosine permease family protein [Rubrobacter calidifluminis]|uniref:purine-cytosine permease family protein n=1 Tax=Rubrobacter calidifluminis TaxID=1392640 RepID=UPI002360679B|nr:cytosine permease [Rubrobacter calidifluminis]